MSSGYLSKLNYFQSENDNIEIIAMLQMIREFLMMIN